MKTVMKLLLATSITSGLAALLFIERAIWKIGNTDINMYQAIVSIGFAYLSGAIYYIRDGK